MKTAQEQRQSLRDRWLGETTPPPVLLTLDSLWPSPLQRQDEVDEHTAAERTKSQKTPEDETEEAAVARKEVSQEGNTGSVNCTAAARTHSHYQAGTDKDVQVNKKAMDHFSTEMAQRTFHESGQDGRSVLGMLAVQVEKDPKTGATIVRSVAPVSSPAGDPKATTVFDDGRKSIHAVGGSVGQPSTEELGQILSVIGGVGMQVLLDEVTVTPNKAETQTGNVEACKAPEGKVSSFTAHCAMSQEDNWLLDSPKSDHSEAEWKKEKCAVSVGNTVDKMVMAVRDTAEKIENMDDQRLEEEPVTLVFLGYADDTNGEGDSQDGHEGVITVERVMITEDGEEHVLGPETPASLQAESDQVAEQEAKKEPQDQAFQDIPLNGNGAVVKEQREEGDKGLHNSPSPITAEGEGTSKRKACQCCSVM